MLDINAAITDAYKRTRYLVWERRSWARWWRYALLSALTGGGGGKVQLPVGGLGEEKKKSTAMMGMLLATSALSTSDTGFIGIMVAVVAIALMLGLFFAWLSSCAQFILLENVVYDRHSLLEPLGRLKGRGLSLLLFTMAVLLAILVPYGLTVTGGAVAFSVAFPNPEDNVAALILGILMVLASLLGVMLFLGAILATTNDLVVPVMYRQQVSPTAGWGLLWPGLRQRKLDWFLILLVQLGLSLGGGMAVLFALLAIALVAGLILLVICGIPAFLCFNQGLEAPAMLIAIAGGALLLLLILGGSFFLQMPVTILVRCFGVYALQQIMPEFGLLPLGGRPLEPLSEFPTPSQEPAPLGSLPDHKEEWKNPEF